MTEAEPSSPSLPKTDAKKLSELTAAGFAIGQTVKVFGSSGELVDATISGILTPREIQVFDSYLRGRGQQGVLPNQVFKISYADGHGERPIAISELQRANPRLSVEGPAIAKMSHPAVGDVARGVLDDAHQNG